MRTVVQPEYGWADTEATCAHAYLAPVVTAMLANADPSDRRVLEIGCGNGAMARLLAADGHGVTAFDAAPDGIEQARSLPSSVSWAVASVYDEDLGSRFGSDFPIALCLEVVEHLLYPRRLFAAAGQCLRPGGLLVVSTPYHGYVKNLALALAGAWDRHFTVGWDGGHIKFFSRASLGALAREAGFREVGFRGVGRLPLLWKSMVVRYRKP
jgi:2-polyprenyl-3-methyl-5-hydroxy-6-metoxy-1,4-benzoquinol methylase